MSALHTHRHAKMVVGQYLLTALLIGVCLLGNCSIAAVWNGEAPPTAEEMMHFESLERLRRDIEGAHENGQQVTLLRKQGHTVRSYSYKDNTVQVDISAMNQILSVTKYDDKEGGSAWVEPLVTMQDMVRAFLPMGLIPCVVPEFRGITVGGSIQGLAAESSSYRKGFFHDTVQTIEVMLGDGEIITARADNEYEDLFHGMAGSYGSLGIVTAAEIELCPALPYVQVEVRTFQSAAELLGRFQLSVVLADDVEFAVGGAEDGGSVKASGSGGCDDDGGGGGSGGGGGGGGGKVDGMDEEVSVPSFLDGIGFSQDMFVEIRGTFMDPDAVLQCEQGHDSTDSDVAAAGGSGSGSRSQQGGEAVKLRKEKGNQTQAKVKVKKEVPMKKRFNAFLSPWYFKCIEKLARKATNEHPVVFITPTEDYLFRYDRGSFWMASYNLPAFLGRLLGGPPSAKMFQMANWLRPLFPRHQIVLQDFMLPIDELHIFIDYIDGKLGVWPLWLLPMANRQIPGRHILSIPGNEGTYCNLGTYGIPKKNRGYDFERDNKEMEEMLSAVKGRKVFYSHAYFTESQFAELYDMEAYDVLRERYKAKDAFKTVYEKVITVGLDL